MRHVVREADRREATSPLTIAQASAPNATATRSTAVWRAVVTSWDAGRRRGTRSARPSTSWRRLRSDPRGRSTLCRGSAESSGIVDQAQPRTSTRRCGGRPRGPASSQASERSSSTRATCSRTRAAACSSVGVERSGRWNSSPCDGAHELRCDDVRGVLDHRARLQRGGRSHRVEVLLAGAGRDRAGAGRVGEHLALVHERGGGVLGDHQARGEARPRRQERRQAGVAGGEQRVDPPFENDASSHSASAR